jgi:hypothetical protein
MTYANLVEHPSALFGFGSELLCHCRFYAFGRYAGLITGAANG